MNILVIHGPNLNLLGEREPDVYGKVTLSKINEDLVALGEANTIKVTTYQSNHEGEIVSEIGSAPKKYDGIVINPAAYTHTSVAIRDAISAISIPVVEVHLSNIYARESFRHESLISPVAIGQVSGFGAESYSHALLAIASYIKNTKKSK